MLPTLAFVLVTGFTLNNGSVSTIVVPGLADENECHKLALKLNTPKHGCFEYRIATPHADVADAVHDELQDSGIIKVMLRDASCVAVAWAGTEYNRSHARAPLPAAMDSR